MRGHLLGELPGLILFATIAPCATAAGAISAAGETVARTVKQIGEPAVSTGPATCAADLNGVGRVSSDDLAVLLGSWGVCP